MGNCLETQLKERVNNDNLILFKAAKFITAAKTIGSSDKIEINNNNACIVKAMNGSFSTSVGGAQETSKNYDASQNITLYGSPSGSTLNITEKYGLNIFRCSASTVMSVDLDEFKYCTSLTDFRVNNANGSISAVSNLTSLTRLELGGANLNGNLSSLSSLTNLTILQLGPMAVCYVTGNIASLGNLTKLTRLSVRSREIEGNIESLVAGFVHNGKSTNTSTFFLGSILGNVTYKTAALNIDGSNLSWGPNAVNSLYTDIAYDSKETTIAVNAQGGWSYVNQDMSKYTG